MASKLAKLVCLIHFALAISPTSATAQDCFQSTVLSPSPFMGNDGETFKLADGSIWQVKYEYEYLYQYSPEVLVCPAQGKLIIGEKSLNIEPISLAKSRNSTPASNSPVIESQIDGDFEGFEGETIIKLVNGQIWQQAEYWYHYHYSFMPKVIIYKQGSTYKMKVNGVNKSVGVVRLH